MKYAIIAAGEGSRLATEGVNAPKPLVRINGETLIDRLLHIFTQQKAEEIVVICNEKMPEVVSHLEKISHEGLNGQQIPLRFISRSTPSSMHSFYEISQWLNDGPFVLTTVDTIFHEEEFSLYVRKFEDLVTANTIDGLMGVTDYIDDEKPLYVKTDDHLNVTAFVDTDANPKYVSGGIYALSPRCIETLHKCIDRGESRMRNFQRALLIDGLHLQAYPLRKVLDIDHASDIEKAEMFLKNKISDL